MTLTNRHLIGGLILALVMLAVSYDPKEQPDGTVKERIK